MQQIMGDLPEDRLELTEKPYAFDSITIDVCGFFLCKRARSVVKRYCLVNLCQKTRAVSFEILFDLSSDSFLNAFSRHICRKGTPSLVRSDCGSNFIGAQSELTSMYNNLDEKKVRNEMTKRNIEWQFLTPKGSNFNGGVERSIRGLRRVLGALRDQQFPSEDVLLTWLTEAEALVNSRPIGLISDDPNDLQPLTPNHFLSMRGLGIAPNAIDKNNLFSRRTWKQVQYLSQVFWNRWHSEYVSSLQTKQMWTRLRRNLKVGDVVLMIPDHLSDQPRGHWTMGRVEKTFLSADNLVRKAEIKAKSKTYLRPISKLVMLVENDN